MLAVLVVWALVRRGGAGVALAMLILLSVVQLPQALAMPIASAVTHAALACAVAVTMAWWVLRRGRSLGMDGR